MSKRTTRRSVAFEKLCAGLEDAHAYHRGENRDLSMRYVELKPVEPA